MSESPKAKRERLEELNETARKAQEQRENLLAAGEAARKEYDKQIETASLLIADTHRLNTEAMDAHDRSAAAKEIVRTLSRQIADLQRSLDEARVTQASALLESIDLYDEAERTEKKAKKAARKAQKLRYEHYRSSSFAGIPVFHDPEIYRERRRKARKNRDD